MKLANHNSISLLGYMFGFMFAFLSAVRYFVMWPDLDKAIVYVLIGILICVWSYEHSSVWNLRNTVDYMENQLESKWKKKAK